MKKAITIFISATILFSCQPAVAQPAPVITDKYTNEKIKELLIAFKMSDSRDIMPPVNIKSKFDRDFPYAKDIDWETALDIYEIEFEIGRIDYKCYYDKNGELLMYYFEIQQKGLPALVKNAAIARYPDYNFDDMKEIHRGTEIFYDIELKHRKIEVDMIINQDGTIIREELD